VVAFVATMFKDMFKLFVKNGKRYIISTLIIGLVFTSIYYLGAYGVWGSIIIVIGLVIYKLVYGRSQFMAAIRHLETKIWGKPLDKDKWKDEEK